MKQQRNGKWCVSMEMIIHEMGFVGFLPQHVHGLKLLNHQNGIFNNSSNEKYCNPQESLSLPSNISNAIGNIDDIKDDKSEIIKEIKKEHDLTVTSLFPQYCRYEIYKFEICFIRIL
jgi:hypothetical protein